MVILSHTLDLRELGFASVLTATIGFIELSTDIAIYRFVYSAPKEEFDSALASAHALYAVRGLVLGAFALVSAPFIAAALSLRADWGSFASLAPIIVLRSFEQLAPRVAERDYRYWPQLKTTLASYGIGLATLFISASSSRSHISIIIAMYAQVLVMLVATRVFSDLPYRLDYRSHLFVKAFRFAYPLMFNGLGLAVSGWADRFIVAAAFSLQTVGVYSVVLLATTVPIGMISRILGTTVLANFYHAATKAKGLEGQVRLAARLVPLLAAAYAGGVMLLTNTVIPLVFGQQFLVGWVSACLLGMTAFVRIVRSDPFTSLMLTAGRTRRLAASNILVSSSLVYMVVFSRYSHTIHVILAARLLGELTSFVFTFYMAREVPDVGRLVVSWWAIVGLAFAGSACLATFVVWRSGNSFAATLLAFTAYSAAILIWAGFALRPSYRRCKLSALSG